MPLPSLFAPWMLWDPMCLPCPCALLALMLLCQAGFPSCCWGRWKRERHPRGALVVLWCWLLKQLKQFWIYRVRAIWGSGHQQMKDNPFWNLTSEVCCMSHTGDFAWRSRMISREAKCSFQASAAAGHARTVPGHGTADSSWKAHHDLCLLTDSCCRVQLYRRLHMPQILHPRTSSSEDTSHPPPPIPLQVKNRALWSSVKCIFLSRANTPFSFTYK